MLRLFPLVLLCAVACDGTTDTGKGDSGDTNIGMDSGGETGSETGQDTANETGETGLTDEDGDGYAVEGGDCNDADTSIHPGAEEIWYDGIDQNCDGNDGDKDGDGEAKSGAGGTDCNDDDASVYPGATEVCDGLDQDCDGAIDEDAANYWFFDGDGDGYGNPEIPLTGCEGGVGYVTNSDDCDDEDPIVNPAATDECDGKDNNCDGAVDEGSVTTAWYLDADGDGYGDSTSFLASCYAPAGYVESWFDCDDTDAGVNPGADEVCDGIDNDCDKVIDPDTSVDAGTWTTDNDGDGYGDDGTAVTTCTQPADTVGMGGDCDDTDLAVNPAAIEACNLVDDNCDGAVDEAGATGESTWYTDADSDGFGDASTAMDACFAAAGQVSDSTDCDDTDGAVNPGATEVCNGYDDNCDSAIDEDLSSTYYEDLDGDGYGDASSSLYTCAPGATWVADSSDCDDLDGAVNPGATEVCDGIDNDCEGGVDEAGAVGEQDWYTDADGDGYGDDTSLVTQCDAPVDGVNTGLDCDDGNAATYDGATELCDGEDNDCDGSADDSGLATWWNTLGTATDLTADLAAGTASAPVVIGDSTSADLLISNGTVRLCDATWYARVTLVYAATDLTVESLNGPDSTTLDGAYSTSGLAGSVVSVTNGALAVTGFTITGGNGTSSLAGGGAIASRSLTYGALPTTPNLTLTDDIITGNTTRYGGGVAAYGYAWIDMVDTLLTDNTATVVGGGFWVQNHGEVSCTASALGAAGVTANTAPTGGGGYLASQTDGVIDFMGCDFGEDASGDDNATYDIQQAPAASRKYCYTNAASLTDSVACAGGACTASTDTTCP